MKKIGLSAVLGASRSDWFWYMLMVFTFCIPLSQYLSTRILGFVFLISLIQCRPSLVITRAWDILLYLVTICIGLLYSEDISFGMRVLETSLSLIFIPIIFSSVSSLDEKKLSRLMFVFLISMCLGSVGSLIYAFMEYFKSGSVSSFLYYELTSLLDFQPTYFAYFLVFSVTVGLYMLFYERAPVSPVIVGMMILFLFFVLMLTGGRTSFISILLVFSFFVLKFFLEKVSRIQRVTFGLVVFMMAWLFGTTALVGDSTAFSDSWERYDLWRAAIQANGNPLMGVGTGDYKGVLNEFFISHGMPEYASESLNAHNQFIQTYLSNGLLGLIAVILLIGRPLFLAFRRDNTITILVLFPFLIYGMTEVFLGRYQGVVFFAFVHQVFVTYVLTISRPQYSLNSV